MVVWALGRIRHQARTVFLFSFTTIFGILWSLNLLEQFHGGSLQLHRIKYSRVVLIPKKGKIKEVGDFRPINVLKVSVKILSKILVNRLRGILGVIIDAHQPSSWREEAFLSLLPSPRKWFNFLIGTKFQISCWSWFWKGMWRSWMGVHFGNYAILEFFTIQDLLGYALAAVC